ncbi:MAG: HAMP domain-containing sensor histidine kinase [Burkholderiaceae bacterium]
MESGPHDGFDHAPCGLLVTDADGTIRRSNATLARWLGYAANDLVDVRTFQSLLTMGGRIFQQTHWAPLLQLQGSVAEVHLDMLHRDGRTLPMIMNAVRRDDGGPVRHEIAVFVTEERHRFERELIAARKRAEELLANQRAAQRALEDAQAQLNVERDHATDRAHFAEQLVGIVSHDLRNPLSAIKLNAALLGREALSSQQSRALARIDSSSARAQRLIADLLDFTQARIGRGLRVVPAVNDLHGVVRDAIEELRVVFPNRQLVHEEAGTGEARFDADRVMQLLGNLVANAVAYGDGGTPVRVRSTNEEATTRIEVHNAGRPIDPALQSTLFDAMTRGIANARADNPNRSIGLGLFIVREIARAHAGEAAVRSDADHGTSFVASWPRVAPARAAGGG